MPFVAIYQCLPRNRISRCKGDIFCSVSHVFPTPISQLHPLSFETLNFPGKQQQQTQAKLPHVSRGGKCAHFIRSHHPNNKPSLLNEVLPDRNTSKELLRLTWCLLIGKGKATKFCNSAKGAFSPRLTFPFPPSFLCSDLVNEGSSLTLLLIR